VRDHYGDAAQHGGGSGREGGDVAKMHDYHVTQLEMHAYHVTQLEMHAYHVTQLAKIHRRLARAACVLLRAYARVHTCTSAHAH